MKPRHPWSSSRSRSKPDSSAACSKIVDNSAAVSVERLPSLLHRESRAAPSGL
jgi:hypothetical protein